SGNRVGGSSLTTGSSVSGEFQLDAGNYTLALILGNQSQQSLLAGYKIDQQDSTSNNSGRNNSGSGSSGGGGGGSLGLLGVAVFALLAVFRRKFYAV
ncbi:MAG: GlyGly-CTERM sorting domain-containing protein, partial [Pseudomonadales bacterium]|nr:GlyGly-CTERM sorting domain-containing protein [Pseudomonadales bacterium]